MKVSDSRRRVSALLNWKGPSVFALAVLGFLSLPPQAGAAGRVYHVRQDGSGDFTTINACVNAMAGGDICLIGPGVYQERIRFPAGKSGAAGALTVVKAETPGTVDTWGADTLNCNYVHVEGLNVSIPSSLTGWTDGVGIVIRSSNAEVVSNYIHDAHYASISGSGNNELVRGNHAYRCGYGIIISGTGWVVEQNDIERTTKYPESGDADNMRFFGSNHLIRSNHIYGTLSTEIGAAHVDCFQTFDDAGDIAQHIVVENNLCEGYFHQGFMLEATFHSNNFDIVIRNNIFIAPQTYAVAAFRNMRDVKVYNNLVINPDIFGVRIAENSQGEVRNNIFYSNKSGIPSGDIRELTYSADTTSTLTAGDHNLLYLPNVSITPSWYPNDIVNQNPQWVNLAGNNFHLLSNSPAINAGATLTGFNYDRDGVTRPQGAAWDIGPYEFGSGPDLLPPQLSGINAASITTNSAVIGWTTSKSANSRVDYGITTSYGSAVSNAALVVSHSVGVSNLAPNTLYHYHVFSQDAAGNRTNSADATFTTLVLDTLPPTVSLTTPAANAVLSNTVTFSATASDNIGVAGVSFLVDGTAVVTTPNSPFSINWDSGSVGNGPHTVAARAVDPAGNATTTAAINVSVQNSAPTLTSGLIGYWPFDATGGTVAADASGNNNNGTLLNGATWGAARLKNGVVLDGVDDYVRVPSSASLEQVTTQLTVSAWVNFSANGDMQSIARKVLSESTNLFPYAAYDLVVLDSGGTSFQARMAVTRSDNTRGLAISTGHAYGAWHHLVGVYDGATVRIFVNGVQEGSAPFSGTLLSTGQPLDIGRYGNVGEAVRGTIDDFRLYNRALSGTEVQTLFNTSAPPAPTNLQILSE